MNLTPNKHILHQGALLVALLYACLSGSFALADDWSLKDKDGVRYSSSGLHGKWVLVSFWAPWCPSCLQEIPELITLQQQHKDLQVIGVAVMYESRKEVLDVVNKQSIPYPIVFGNEDTAGDFGGMSGIPTGFLYSPTGKLDKRYEGPVTKSEIDQAIGQHGIVTLPSQQ